MNIATCIGCGCNDYNACADEKYGGPCAWLEVDYALGRGVCSCCENHLGRWYRGQYEIHVPVDLG